MYLISRLSNSKAGAGGHGHHRDWILSASPTGRAESKVWLGQGEARRLWASGRVSRWRRCQRRFPMSEGLDRGLERGGAEQSVKKTKSCVALLPVKTRRKSGLSIPQAANVRLRTRTAQEGYPPKLTTPEYTSPKLPSWVLSIGEVLCICESSVVVVFLWQFWCRKRNET